MTAATPDLLALQERIGVRFRDESLLLLALTHPSFANEHPDEAGGNNERLEFLGDAALSFVVAEALYESFPDEEEGRLTEWRSQLVMGTTLAGVATTLDLGTALRLGRGEESTGGRERSRNLERVYEALIGAILIDRGVDGARQFIVETMSEEFDRLHADPAVVNPKGALQQLAQGERGRPEYVTVEENGPEHAREFTVEVRVEGETLGTGVGPSKQTAEKAAAREALHALRHALREAQPAVEPAPEPTTKPAES